MKYLIYKKSGRLPIKIKIDKFVWSYAIQALGNYYTASEYQYLNLDGEDDFTPDEIANAFVKAYGGFRIEEEEGE